MSSLIFKLETLNPNLRTTFFKHKSYTNYLANSEYAIKNPNTNHGLFGIVKQFPDIENMKSIDKVSDHITNLADNKVPIYRGVISLTEYDASRLGYLEQEKWKELLESKLPSIARKLNIRYQDIQYVGAVHLEEGHPHLQFMLWSKARDKSNYYVKAEIKNKLRKEFTNVVFREDLLPIYQQKDLAKKNIIHQNKILDKFKNTNKNDKFIKEIIKYEKAFYNPTIMKQKFKDKELQKIVDLLLDLKKDLRNTTGSIKYQYLMRYPEIIKKVDAISNEIISTSNECKIEINNYIKAKQKIIEFQYSDDVKLEEEKRKIQEEAEEEILKLIGNKILDFERNLLYSQYNYSKEYYRNETRNYIIDIYGFLCSLSHREKINNKRFLTKYKKQLSKQAKKEKALEERNSSSWHWEDEY